jgi:hypothetical protein
MDPTKLLKKQHREVEGLFREIEKSDEPQECRRLVDEIAEKLGLHMRIEEEIFYPAIQELGAKKAREMGAEAYEEHAVVKLVLAELPRVDPEDERFHAKMTVLSELIEHHVEEEETEMFKLAQKLGDERLDELGDRMAAAAGEPVDETAASKAKRRKRAA